MSAALVPVSKNVNVAKQLRDLADEVEALGDVTTALVILDRRGTDNLNFRPLGNVLRTSDSLGLLAAAQYMVAEGIQ